MRCAGCELEPKKPARYCECCGKEISQHQHQPKASETIDTDWAPKRSAWDLRCPKCGGPSLDGGICQVCQKPTPPADRAESSSTSNHAGVPAAVPSQAPPDAPRASMTPPGSHSMTAAPTPAPQRAVPPPHFSELQTIPIARERTPTPAPRRSQTDAATPDRSRRPAAASAGRVQSKQPKSAYSFALIAASVAVVAALGAAADWLFVHQDAEVTRTAQATMPAVPEQTAAAASEQPAAAPPASDDRPATRETVATEAVAPSVVRPPAPAPVAAKDPAPAKPKPVPPAKPTRAAAAPAAKPARPQASSNAAPAAAPVLTASAAPAPPVREPAPASPSVEKAAALGPFFETKDVSETPRITARVEPRLPADMKARKVHEIVIVRALVSQNGRPSRVSVLRKSKTGPQLDDMVVAAVNQWTFSPAKKKGEAVSCWFNFGVTVGVAD